VFIATAKDTDGLVLEITRVTSCSTSTTRTTHRARTARGGHARSLHPRISWRCRRELANWLTSP